MILILWTKLTSSAQIEPLWGFYAPFHHIWCLWVYLIYILCVCVNSFKKKSRVFPHWIVHPINMSKLPLPPTRRGSTCHSCTIKRKHESSFRFKTLFPHFSTKCASPFLSVHVFAVFCQWQVCKHSLWSPLLNARWYSPQMWFQAIPSKWI